MGLLLRQDEAIAAFAMAPNIDETGKIRRPGMMSGPSRWPQGRRLFPFCEPPLDDGSLVFDRCTRASRPAIFRIIGNYSAPTAEVSGGRAPRLSLLLPPSVGKARERMTVQKAPERPA
jgi:hypothetical protein